ncbi:hypothetical protein DL764_009414 [Monosporascus ibericus]|uniref:Transcription factor domain-containing protein n=1 Tax=Monosporascus ibericus TaxID=155417 RepID=A0A4Q4SV43_9PEZI|nr:hypothetical protein DL764_009414 [Monosporascus ibericus]
MAPASHSSTTFQQPHDFVVTADPTPEVREVWSAYRFVEMGLISADEAVTFIDAWTEDVINPAKRCERMSWMVLDCAMSLAIEISIFDQAGDAGDAIVGDYGQRLRSRRISLAKLLYFYQEQLSSRLGRNPLMSPNVSHVITLTKTPSVVLKKSGEDWNGFVTAWTELIKLLGGKTFDYCDFIQEVVEGCLETLKLAIRLAEKKVLTFAPLSMFLRITTASVFLLKGLGLGVSTTKLRDSLDTLTRAIAALRTCQSDDLHLRSTFATLLEMPASVESQAPTGTEDNHTDWQMDFGSQIPSIDSMGLINAASSIDEHWLTLPLDPSLVPFVPDDSHGFQWLGDGSLDFVWNLDN